ncbi:hypothetical protein O3M35_006467 [Rhynocoris fuscipes]|uniref:Methionine synthase reductase n=1 Tax=Rhynocoris fuscipes TaxID=488301 RepID=A0AAW1DDU5_9HEMI
MISKELSFPQDKILTLPNLTVSYIKCVFRKTDSYDCGKSIKKKLQNDAPQPLSETPLCLTNILSTKILSEGKDVKTRMEIFIDIKDLEYHYLPGDTVGILPENSENEVNLILKLLGLQDKADDILEISLSTANKKKIPLYISEITTPRHLLKTCLDLRSIVKKGFIRALLEFTEDTTEKRRLEEFCCREGSSEYNKYILENSTCLLDILETFQSCKPPLSLLIEHLPRLMPRAYSIASSPLVYPDSIRIIFTIVQDNRGRDGICTSWLRGKANHLLDLSEQLNELSLTESEFKKIPIFLRKRTKFHIPVDLNSPIIMIGPGTGLAPFIGFLEQRNNQLINKTISSSSDILLFGCRYKNKDFIYKKDLEYYRDEKVLNELFICFSRDNESDEDPKYVQDLFKKHKQNLVNLLINNDAYLFICGDALNMAKDVQEVIVNSISEVQGISNEEAINLLKDLENQGRYVKDVWR